MRPRPAWRTGLQGRLALEPTLRSIQQPSRLSCRGRRPRTECLPNEFYRTQFPKDISTRC
jgi:hypothetical protein